MKKTTLLKLTAFLVALFGIAAFVMMFFTALTTGGDNPSTLKGQEIVFGKELSNIKILGITSKANINFSFMMMLAYFLPLVLGVLVIAVEAIAKNGFVKFLVGAIAFAGFVFALILVALTVNIATVTYSGTLTGETTGTIAEWTSSFGLGIGSILAIVANGLAACGACTYTTLQLLKGKK